MSFAHDLTRVNAVDGGSGFINICAETEGGAFHTVQSSWITDTVRIPQLLDKGRLLLVCLK